MEAGGNVVTLTGGFEPGRNYEIAYRATNPPISGLGLAAVRDAASWLKNAPETLAPVKYVTRWACHRAAGSCATTSTKASTRTKSSVRFSTA